MLRRHKRRKKLILFLFIIFLLGYYLSKHLAFATKIWKKAKLDFQGIGIDKKGLYLRKVAITEGIFKLRAEKVYLRSLKNFFENEINSCIITVNGFNLKLPILRIDFSDDIFLISANSKKGQFYLRMGRRTGLIFIKKRDYILAGKYLFAQDAIFSLNAKLVLANEVFPLKLELKQNDELFILKGALNNKFLFSANISHLENGKWKILGKLSSEFISIALNSQLNILKDKAMGWIEVDKAKFKDHELYSKLYWQLFWNEAKLGVVSPLTLLNNKAIDKFETVLSFANGLKIDSFKYGEAIFLNVESGNNRFHLWVKFSDFDFNSFMSIIYPRLSDEINLGKINGEIKVESENNTSYRSEVRLKISSGFFAGIKYKNGILNLKGRGDKLYFYDSQLSIDSKKWFINGEIDLKRFPSLTMFKDIVLTSADQIAFWDKISYCKDTEMESYSLTTKLKDSISFNYHLSFSDDDYWGREFTLEYSAKDENTWLKFRFREDEEIFGIEKRIDF